MPGNLFKEKKCLVVGETYQREKYGASARDLLRYQLRRLTSDTVEIGEAVHLGTAYIGNEGIPPEKLLESVRVRFRIAGKPFPKRRGDATPVDA